MKLPRRKIKKKDVPFVRAIVATYNAEKFIDKFWEQSVLMERYLDERNTLAAEKLNAFEDAEDMASHIVKEFLMGLREPATWKKASFWLMVLLFIVVIFIVWTYAGGSG